MESIIAFFGGTLGSWFLGMAGFASLTAVLNYFLKKYVTDNRLDTVKEAIASTIAWPGAKIGLFITSAGTKAPIIGKAWNKTFEPWVIVIVRVIGGGIAEGFNRLFDRIVTFMQSDNPSTKG